MRRRFLTMVLAVLLGGVSGCFRELDRGAFDVVWEDAAAEDGASDDVGGDSSTGEGGDDAAVDVTTDGEAVDAGDVTPAE